MKRRSLLLIVVLLVAPPLRYATGAMVGSAAIVRAGSSANYAIPASVVAAGGQTASSANYTITSTVGQPATGQSASASYSLCSGFWCQVQAALAQLFLPLVER